MNLDPIEKASIDELRALQLQRLQWSVLHAYENVAHYRESFHAAGVHPHDLRSLELEISKGWIRTLVLALKTEDGHVKVKALLEIRNHQLWY